MKLAPEGVGAGLSAVIPEGYRAMTVKVDDVVGVSGFIMPGSFVDVVAIIVPSASQGEAQGPISKIVLQNIKVLASGPKLDSPENQREPTAVKAVTLQVTPEQAEKLVLAVNEGKLQLVMRNYSDQEGTQTSGVNKSSLLSGDPYVPQAATRTTENSDQPKPVKRAPTERRSVSTPKEEKPAAVAPPRNSVELIEGNKRREVDMP
jgi:pilus assembly protein CpaB